MGQLQGLHLEYRKNSRELTHGGLSTTDTRTQISLPTTPKSTSLQALNGLLQLQTNGETTARHLQLPRWSNGSDSRRSIDDGSLRSVKLRAILRDIDGLLTEGRESRRTLLIVVGMVVEVVVGVSVMLRVVEGGLRADGC